ncbi:hypothetical protein HDU67_002972 [Dinochytrium kinnereticum]|nr:hypothetical protein HDU67_002972 [Dinochytrium kinnereticum]
MTKAEAAPTERDRKGKKPAKKTEKKSKQDASPPGPRLKAVIRKMPPNLPEAIFLKTISPWQNAVEWTEFVPGRVSKSAPLKDHELSRAYLKFTSVESLLEFWKSYNGWLFKEEKSGIAYRAVVEFAPFQKIPKPKKKSDPRMNTLDADPDYIAFLESLNAPMEEKLAEIATVAEKPKSTPLLDHLRAKKAQAKAAADQSWKASAQRRSERDTRFGSSSRKEKVPAKEKERPSTPTGKQSGSGKVSRRGTPAAGSISRQIEEANIVDEKTAQASSDASRDSTSRRKGKEKKGPSSPPKVLKTNEANSKTRDQPRGSKPAAMKDLESKPILARPETPRNPAGAEPSEKADKEPRPSSAEGSRQERGGQPRGSRRKGGSTQKAAGTPSESRPPPPKKEKGNQDFTVDGGDTTKNEKKARKRTSHSAAPKDTPTAYVPSIVIMKKDGTVSTSGTT